MKRTLIPNLLIFAVAVLAGASGLVAEEGTSLRAAIQQAEIKLSLYYRYETVDDARFDDGHASTLRTALSLKSGLYKGWRLFLEAENVLDIGLGDDHNNAGAGSLNNGVRDRPVIADPELTEVNQAYLRYERDAFHLNLGRQAINLGDQRFVGAVGWRQNHQTFDSARLGYRLGKTDLTYIFLENANRIFGDNKAMASHLVNVAWSNKVGKLTLYGYLIDYDQLIDSTLSTTTLGVEWTGKWDLSSSRWLYELEAAQQSDAGDNPRNVDVAYYHAMVGWGCDALTAKVGFEVLEGEPGQGRFTTPLATLHKFNGWADLFLNTPSPGLEDFYLQLLGKFDAFSWTLIYHEFSSNTGDIDYGEEIDAQITWKSSWNQGFGLKSAFYDADRFGVDIDKIWLFTNYTF